MVEPHGDMSYELEELKALEDKAKEPEGHWLAKYLEPGTVLEESEEEARQYREKYDLLEREHLYDLQQQQGATERSCRRCRRMRTRKTTTSGSFRANR